MNELTCKICNKGTIVNMSVYRMSKVGVAIGYIFLILSALGLLFAVVSLLNRPGPAEDWRVLTNLQRGLAEAAAVIIGFFSFAGALVGLLLIRKQTVLKCNQCGVEIPDSLSGMYCRFTLVTFAFRNLKPLWSFRVCTGSKP